MSCNKVSEDVQMPHGKALGDCWSVINYFINLGFIRNEVIRLSLWYPKGESRKRVDKLKDVLPLFRDDDMIELGEWVPTVSKIHWTEGYKYPFVPTKIRWENNSSKKICYQFDGKSHKAKNFPSIEIEQEVLGHIELEGYECIRLGNNYTLEECMNIMANCELFVGVDSGMCYMAASVGIPIFFCKNDRDINIWDMNHSNKHFILDYDYIGLKNSITKYKEYGLEYYIQNARNINLFKR